MYQALYRKWRPRTFDDVAGQDHITETLKNQIKTGRLSHAYLFIGTRGTGKTTCAKILAKAVNCENPQNGNPCNACKACRGIDDGSVLDVVEMDAASNNGVDNVRALRDEAVFSPAQVKRRVYIVDEVHMLSGSAFNALLKILEEPPAHLMFILATTELQKVPATILSRCQRHSFRRLSAADITKRLVYVAEREGLRLTPDAAALLGRLADGAMRDGLSLLDQCAGAAVIDAGAVLSAMGLAGSLRTAELLRHIAGGDTANALLIFQELWDAGKDPAALLNELAVLLRDLLMRRIAPKGGEALLSGGYDPAATDWLSELFTVEQLLLHMDLLQAALAEMRTVRSPRLCAELCLVKLCEPRLGPDLSALPARVSKLEAALEAGLPPRPAPEPPDRPEPEPEPQYQPRFEPEPGPEPELQPEPEPESEPELEPEPEIDSAGFWRRVVEKLNAPETMGVFFIAGDPVQAEGVLDDGVLTVRAKNKFALDTLSRSAYSDRLREAATAVAGGPVKLLITEASGDAKPAGSLDELLKFGNVTFK